MSKYLFWDFDGTLGGRRDGLKGRAWSLSMLEAINQYCPGHMITPEEILHHLDTGFPWHTPEEGHTHLDTPERWWEHLRLVLSRAFMKLGFDEEQAVELAFAAQDRFLDLDTWELYKDTLPVIEALREQGWRHLIISNHVPELEQIVEHLELSPYLDAVINSAIIGYEKPHQAIFQYAIQMVNHPDRVWMIGDNIHADVLGAEAAGIPAILVRNIDQRAKLQFDNLIDLQAFLIELS